MNIAGQKYSPKSTTKQSVLKKKNKQKTDKLFCFVILMYCRVMKLLVSKRLSLVRHSMISADQFNCIHL